MSRATENARDFLEREKAFRLGELLTESSHPKTRTLSQTIQADLPAGIVMLQSVDTDITEALEGILTQETYPRLIDAFLEAMHNKQRIFFTGCGSTGRLSILLETTWRKFWRGMAKQHPEDNRAFSDMEHRCISVMAGGDFALIKSVEGFEDFPKFGRHQLKEAGVQRGDVVVAITEGGETPFVIGTAWEGLDAGATVFFVYNNPTALLHRHVQRSREVIEEPRIHKLDLTTGPMAIAGSTRMQATTVELLVVGAALETALVRWLDEEGIGHPWAPDEYHQCFARLLDELGEDEAIDTMARLVQFEEEVYREHGLVTYAADGVLLDVLTDTTERSPTFMVPPFRQDDDTRSPVSWAFVKNPFHPTPDAWGEMLQRAPRGLDWGPGVYRQLEAPAAIQADPPYLDNAQIHRFQIGNEPDASRTEAPDSALVTIAVGNETDSLHRKAVEKLGTGYRKIAIITVGSGTEVSDVDAHFHFPCTLPSSPLELWDHLAVKLILNTISTATMVRLERVIGNAMVWVSPSNKKLIDRGTRLIAQQTGCPYEKACEALFEAMEEVTVRSQEGREPPSPVALAIERLSAND